MTADRSIANIRKKSFGIKKIVYRKAFIESGKIQYERQWTENGENGDYGRLKMENAG